MGAYMRSYKKKICVVCNREKYVSAYYGGIDTCRACSLETHKNARMRTCIDCGSEEKIKVGNICRACKNKRGTISKKKRDAERKAQDYTAEEERLLRQFLPAWKRRCRAECECIYMDFKKHLRNKSNQTNSAIEMMKKYIIEWERKPKSKENFEEMYVEFRKVLGIGERTIKNKPQ